MTKSKVPNVETDRSDWSVSPYLAGLKRACPKCGTAPLFQNILEVNQQCGGCGFDLSAADPGDGAQVFVILILGAVSAVVGFVLYGILGMPLWALVIILGGMVMAGSIWLLRVFKATLIALQFHHDAHEGKLVAESESDEA